MLKHIASVFIGVLLAVGLFLYIQMEVRDHKRLNQVVDFLNSQIQKSAKPLPTK